MDDLDDFVAVTDLSREQLFQLYEQTDEMKEFPESYYHALEDQTLLMLFEKPSTRTRVSFETGMTQMGGHGINFAKDDAQLSRGESLKDTAKAVSRYVDGIMARVYDHDKLLALQKFADVPVINGLTDRTHPCQAVADLYTLRERVDDLSTLDIAYIGDGNNVAHSLLRAATLCGADVTISCPQGYEPSTEIIDQCRATGEETGTAITVQHDPHHAVRDANVVYTDVWVSMGDEDEQQERLRRFRHYQVDQKLIDTGDDPYVMHPLPAHRGLEITDDVIDGPNSIVYDQAENRLHVQKALLHGLMTDT